jgi:hypothetical protein
MISFHGACSSSVESAAHSSVTWTLHRRQLTAAAALRPRPNRRGPSWPRYTENSVLFRLNSLRRSRHRKQHTHVHAHLPCCWLAVALLPMKVYQILADRRWRLTSRGMGMGMTRLCFPSMACLVLGHAFTSPVPCFHVSMFPCLRVTCLLFLFECHLSCLSLVTISWWR